MNVVAGFLVGYLLGAAVLIVPAIILMWWFEKKESKV
jgi:hypothetical protein